MQKIHISNKNKIEQFYFNFICTINPKLIVCVNYDRCYNVHQEFLYKNSDIFNFIFNLASAQGHLEVIKYLILNNYDLYSNVKIAYMFAIYCNQLDVVNFFTASGLITYDYDEFALESATRFGYLDIVKLLITESRNKNTLLLDATIRGHYEIVDVLLKNGANVCKSGSFVYASLHGHTQIVKLLFKTGKISKSQLHCALDHAVNNGRLKVVQLLCTHIEPRQKPIMLAVKDRHFDILDFFIHLGIIIPKYNNKKYHRYVVLREKVKERLSKKIYFWWIQVCYNMNNKCGQRMMQKQLKSFRELTNS